MVKGDGGWEEGDIVSQYVKQDGHTPAHIISKHTPVSGLLSCGCDLDGSVF